MPTDPTAEFERALAAGRNGDDAPPHDGADDPGYWAAMETDPEAAAPPATPGRFPAEFWDKRPLFAHVRQAARARLLVSPEALLLAVLGNVTTYIPAAINLPGPPRLAPTNLLVCVAGPPGAAKGAVFDAAKDVLPAALDSVHRKLGSAQGFVRSFWEHDESGGKGTTWRRHTRPVVFRTNEVGTLAGLMSGDSGALLLGEVKSAWSGEALGFDYVGPDKAFPVAELSYRMLGLFGVAPAKAAPLFTDAGGGAPDRLLFAIARRDCDVTLDNPPKDPGRWKWAPNTKIPDNRLFTVEADVQRKIGENLLARADDDDGDDFEAHIDLQRLKVAAAVAYADKRWDVTGDDFEIAGTIIGAHRQVRDYVRAAIASAERERYEAGTRLLAGRSRALREDERVEAEAIRRRRVVDAARRLADRIRAEPMSRRLAVQAMRRARDVFDDALDHAKAEGWIVEQNAPTPTGSESRLLIAGPKAPR